MKVKSLVIGIIVCVVIAIVLLVVLIIVKSNKTPKVEEDEPEAIEEKIEKPLVVFLDEEKSEEVQEEPQIRDAATITREIQEMGKNIGNLKILKTGLSTEVFCKQDANKMEEVPCMLYTNNGPNQPGITILVGHNRANGTLFSDNNKLEENDELYFTDYINGEEKKYIVYSKFVTSNDDVSFYNNQSDDSIIAMQCCLTPTDSKNVLIIMAKPEN